MNEPVELTVDECLELLERGVFGRVGLSTPMGPRIVPVNYAMYDDAIVFPGFFVREQIDPLTCRYFVGERCARVLRGLERASELGGTPRTPPRRKAAISAFSDGTRWFPSSRPRRSRSTKAS